jgi:hypothetical protein
MGITSGGRERADESIARRFSRLMKASTSPLGVLTDPPIVAVTTALPLVGLLAALQVGAPQLLIRLLGALVALPIAAAVVVTVSLGRARSRVVDWLSRVSFPVENMNAVLNGVGELLEIQFAGELPTSPELNAALEAVHPDAFVIDTKEEPKLVDVRIGVIDSKRNPAKTNHARYLRVQRIVDDVLVPLHARTPIVSVRVK